MAELPTGTVTFLFTDLESSTRLWEEQPEEAMGDALARHDTILHDAIDRHHGVVFATMGDGMAAAFASARDALAAALDAQRRLAAEPWDDTGALRARMGLHSDEGRLRAPGEYVNRPLNRCARLMAVAHGGQVVVSSATAAVARDCLPPGAHLVDLGEHQLRDLAEPVRMFQLAHPDLRAEFPPPRSLDALPGNLPRLVTTFVGRQREVVTLSALVHDRSVVTLTGVGGVGKTRLAVQVAAEVVADFSEGAWLCELAPVVDPDAVWATLASSLGVRRSAGRALDQSVLEYLAPKQLLLLLDNCEHLLDVVARVVGAIEQHCPHVTVLATSREGLAIAGEQIVAVPSLGVPAVDADEDALAQADAVRLFCDRARDVTNDFALTRHNSSAIAQLCRRLDGIPLAIELAAARVRSISPEDLVARLDQRFRLLTRGSRAALERQQTLRNTIDWSYDLLDAMERDALNRLSVFAGGCDLPAAEAILPGDVLGPVDVADVLSQLVDKSLLLLDTDRAGGARYRLLETIRQYAQERLEAGGETAGVRRRHADHYVAVAETVGPHLRGREVIAWSAAASRDADNMRAVLDWAVETPSADHALRLAAALSYTGVSIGWAAIDWAAPAVAIPGAEMHELFPVVAAFAALGAVLQWDIERAAVLTAKAQEAQDALGTNHIWVHMAHSTLAFFRRDHERAQHDAMVWVELARAGGDPYEIARSLVMLGNTLHPDPARAEVVLDEAARISREAGLPSPLAYALLSLGIILPPDESARALVALDEAATVMTELGDRQGLASTITMKAGIAGRLGDWRASLQVNVEAVELNFELGQPTTLWPSLWGAAMAFANLGCLEPAAVLIGLADAHFARFGTDEFLQEMEETERALLSGLGEPRLAVLRARGAALDVTDGVGYLRVESERALRP